MKAMKKILMLTLIFALALCATAFATETQPNLTNGAKIVEVIKWFDAHDGKCAKGHKVTGTWTPEADLNADCTLDGSVDVACAACGKYWKGTYDRAASHTWGTAVVDETKTVAPTCITAGKVTEVVKCEKCAVTNETVTSNTPAAYGHDLLKGYLFNAMVYDVSKPMTEREAQNLVSLVEWWNVNYASNSAGEKHDSYAFQGKYLKAEYVPADACKAGYIKVWCDYCDEVLFEQEFAGKHEWKLVSNFVAVLPTCTTPGEIYVECKECGLQEKKFVRALEHEIAPIDYYRQNGEIVAKVNEDGEIVDLPGKDFVECQAYQVVRICENAEITLNSMKIHLVDVLSELDPNPKAVEDLVVELLNKVDISVAKCDHIEYVDGAKIKPALWDHVYDLNIKDTAAFKREFSIEGYFEGNCTEPEHFYVCCNGCDWNEKIVGDVPGHDWCDLEDGEVIKAATCSANGEIKLHCEVKNCDGTTTVTTDKLPHTLAWHHTGSCYYAGKLIEQCNVCKEVTQEIAVSAWHDPAQRKNIVLTNAFEYKRVNDNGLVTVIYALEDCTKDGTVKYFCDVCDHTITETIDKTGHSYNLDAFIEDLKDGKLRNDGEDYKKVVLSEDKSDEVIDNKFDSELDGIVEPTCSTYGYVYLECMNEGCTHVAKVKFADKLNHFDKIDEDAKTAELIKPTCTTTGTETKVCACGYTETTEIAMLSHTPTKIDGKDVCVVCGTELKLDQHVKYNIQTTEMTVTNTSVSGRGVIDRPENLASYTYELYARINYNFTLDNGETVAYVACVEVGKDGSFRAASPACPYGATLTNVAIMITTDADAQDKLISEVTNMGITVIK